MAEPVWNKFLTERDKQVFGAAGYGQRAGFGERPAVIVSNSGVYHIPPVIPCLRIQTSCGRQEFRRD